MEIDISMFDPSSLDCRYYGWTPEPTLEDAFNHESGAFISFGAEDSIILTHDKFDLEYFFKIDIEHFEAIFEKAGIDLHTTEEGVNPLTKY